MNDLMLTAVLSMPYDMAMENEFSRRQFWDRAQQALAEIERLTAERDNLQRAVMHEADCVEAAKAEIERLTAALQYEQHRAERQGTHGPGCADWGPAHYECAVAEIERLRADAGRLDMLANLLQDVQIGEIDPTMHYLDGEEDVAWPVLWRRAIDAARKA